MVRWSWVVAVMIRGRRLWSDGHGSWVRWSNGHGGGWAMEVSSSSSSSSFFVVVCGRGFGSAWVMGHRSWVYVCVMGFGSCGFWFGVMGLLWVCWLFLWWLGGGWL